MELSEQDIIQLEAWWRGELKEDKQALLMQKLEENEAFRIAASQWYHVIYKGFSPTDAELETREVISNQLKELEASLPTLEYENKAVFSWNFRQWLIAASIGILAFLSTLWLLNRPVPPPDYFTHLARDNASLSELRTAGDIAYEEKDYQAAWKLLEIEIQTSNDSLNLLYAGVAALGAGESQESIRMLEAIFNSPEWTIYRTEIIWYLALAYWEEDVSQKAIPFLEEVVSVNSSHAEQARKLLEEIR